MLRPLNIILLILMLSQLGCQKTDDVNKTLNQNIANYFDNLVDNRDFSGIVLIGNSKEILSTYVSGYSDFTTRTEHKIYSKFGIASISKTFTAAAILQLRNEKKLKLDDYIEKYLPDFKYGNEITVLQLLQHRSGLADIDYRKYENEFLDSRSLISELEKNPLLFQPGKYGSYSNAGYSVLARIIEKASGLKYEEYLKTKLLQPLHMNNTGDLSTQNMPEELSLPFFPNPPPELVKPILNSNNTLNLGSGSIYSTGEDLWKWGVSIMNKSKVNFFDEVYPFGWGRDSIAGEFCLNQTGMNEGFTSSLFLFPDKGIVIVLLSNIEDGMWVDWTKDVAKIFFGDTSKIYYPQKRNLSKDQINPDQFTGTYRLNSDKFVEIKAEGNNLFLHLDGYYRRHYLTPIGNNTFELRSFTGKISFIGKDSLKWTLPEAWGGSSEIYLKKK